VVLGRRKFAGLQMAADLGQDSARVFRQSAAER
jgi:hypothetical protein